MTEQEQIHKTSGVATPKHKKSNGKAAPTQLHYTLHGQEFQRGPTVPAINSAL